VGCVVLARIVLLAELQRRNACELAEQKQQTHGVAVAERERDLLHALVGRNELVAGNVEFSLEQVLL